ncbi:MAG: 2-amino-4-hydroxy-6-hydroxymethyldihydropteridine diphosphokinase [Chloroflexi bacterium]|nr:2-amino-4-hydroxy-6-hydroxymethyldihydropteridine diphosphokinase [Chloroflexota bacterium]
MKHSIYLGLGSNLNDRLKNLAAAIASMPPTIKILRTSPIYETAPWGFEDQGKFLNQVVEAQTDLTPKELLDHLKNIETEVGRTATFRNGPREIDIDILFYDNFILDTDDLTIPHARIEERAFMLAPLAVIAEEFIHPVSGQTIAQLLAKVDTGGVKPFEAAEN